MTNHLTEPLDAFKERELEILTKMAAGFSNKQIAEDLFITVATVRWYNKQIYSKLGTSRRTEAIAVARKMGLLEDPEATPQTSTHTPPIHKLPVTTGPFVGRDDEIAEVTVLLQQPEVRLLSIIAAGGMGKSRLSLEVAHRIKIDYEHGAAFIDLAPARDPADVVAFAVNALGLTVGNQQEPKDALLNYCRQKTLLLIFDNFEHVLGGASLLAEILETAPNVTLIATTREKLNLRAETTFFLEPVTQHGQQLFVEVAAMMHPNVAMTEADFPHIDQVVDLVGGMPLALVLAATWVDMLSVEEIVTEIQQSLDFLGAELGDMPDRQRSIRAVVDPTWTRLTEEEQQAFMWASVFRGGFTRETFQQVTGASLRTIQTLLNRSLIAHGYGRRYDMHPLLRQYAREKLEAQGAVADAKNAHLIVFVEYAQTHAERMYDGYYLESLDVLELEQDNFRAGLDWSLQGNAVEQGIELILALCDFWQIRSRAIEAVDYLEQACELSTHPMLFYWMATFLERLGRIDEALDYARQAIEFATEVQDQVALTYAGLRLYYLNAYTDNTDLEQNLYKIFAAAKLQGNHQLLATCHNVLGNFLSTMDSGKKRAHEHYQRALDLCNNLGDLLGISKVTNNIAMNYYDDPERRPEAYPMMEHSLQLKRQIGDRAGEARRLTTMGIWASEDEDFELAQRLFAESRAICEELGELDRLSYTVGSQGILHLIMMDFDAARAFLEECVAISKATKDTRGVIGMYGFLCQLHLLQGQVDEAWSYIIKGVEMVAPQTTPPTILVLAYANAMWHKQDVSSCVKVLATLSHQPLSHYFGNRNTVDRYFFKPLVYQVQQHIGDAAWQQTLADTVDVTPDDLLQKMIRRVG